MDQLHKLEHSRELFGYNTKDFKKYSKHTKNQIKYFNKTNNESFTKILKCENFLSRCYLEKNKKLKRKLIEKIIKFAENFENGLNFYYKGMAYFLSKNFKESKEELVKSRSFFEENPIFLQEIDYFLDLNANKLNEPSLKPSKEKGMWNDIELQFNTLKEKEDFFSYKIKEVKGNDFDSLLKNFILKIHFRKENLIKLIKKSNTAKLKNIKEKSKQLFLILKEFLLFSQKNYISSEFIDLFYKDTQNLFYFFKNLEERNEGNFENEKAIFEFKTPTNFEEISKFIEQSKKEIKFDVKKVKSKLMQQLEKNIQVEESKINLPFLPVFYDLAYEFIDYELEPSSKKGISGLLSKFSSSFSLKK